jgi:hypothetical protein
MNIQSEAERKHEEILSKYVSPRHGVLTKENALKAMRELEESLSPASPVREALEKIVRAWESLPGNKNYAPKEIERWLGDVMSPAIDAAREALAARTEGDGWIKVEDWKPDENSKVWIAFADNSVEEGYYKTWNNELCFTDLKGWKYVEEITHYKLYSIPKPPL